MLEFFQQMDLEVLFLINGSHTPWLDQWMWFSTQTLTWLPFYLLGIWALWLCYRRNFWKALLLIIFAVLVSEFIASGVLKPLVQRPRPTHCPELFDRLRLFIRPNGKIYYGGLYSFPSAHAANSCTIALTLYLLLQHHMTRSFGLGAALTAYVLLVSYTRPYLGVHYPSDILVGWLLGGVVVLCCIVMNDKFNILPRKSRFYR